MYDSVDINVVSCKFVEDFVRAFANDAEIPMFGQERFWRVTFGIFLQGFNCFEKS